MNTTGTTRRQPFYAVRVTVNHDDGSTSTRDYVREQCRLGRAAFAAFALGDMLALVTNPGCPIVWDVVEIDEYDVAERAS